MSDFDGTDVFESLRMKARKLAALAARGVGGEKQTAQAKLEAFLTRWNMTLESLDAGERRERELACVLDPAKPCKDLQLARLAGQCLAYVLGQKSQHRTFICQRGKTNAKGRVVKVSFYVLRAELTDAEFEDWEACFQCYAPSFESTRVRLRRALKQALHGFVHAHDIFPPQDSDGKAKPLSPAELQALIDAMRQAQGDKWKRPAGRIQQTNFLLT